MYIFLLATILTLAPSIYASPTRSDITTRSACMCYDEAEKVANNFKDLINKKFSTTLAEASITPSFHDYSDSVNELINAGCTNGPKPLGTVTFASRAEFISSQSTQSPIPFSILNLWHTCDTVIMRWQTTAPGERVPEQEVTGIVVIEAVPNSVDGTDQPWLIDTVYSEFNSGAWLYDAGNFTASCTPSARLTKRESKRTVTLRAGSIGRGTLL